MIRDFIVAIVVRYFRDQLTVEVLAEWASKFREIFMSWTDEIINRLAVEAAKTDTPIDDLAVEKLRIFRDQLIPNCEIKLD